MSEFEAELLRHMDRQTELLEKILQAVQKKPGRKELNGVELKSMHTLLKAVGGKFGSEVFTVNQLLLDETLSAVAGHPDPRDLGVRFLRAVGHDIAGLVVERAGMDRENKVLWQVLKSHRSA